MNQEEITKFLLEKYAPQAILLFGSRMEGTSKEDSDWDVFVIGDNDDNLNSELLEYNGDLLDLTFKNFPENGEPLTTAIKPLWPVKVLFDDSNGKLLEVLKINEEAFRKGPLTLYKDGVSRRFGTLLRRQTKIKKYENDKESQFIFTASFLELAVRLWFELQNEWSLPMDKAMITISARDSDFAKWLSELCENDSRERIGISDNIVERLKMLR